MNPVSDTLKKKKKKIVLAVKIPLLKLIKSHLDRDTVIWTEK